MRLIENPPRRTRLFGLPFVVISAVAGRDMVIDMASAQGVALDCAGLSGHVILRFYFDWLPAGRVRVPVLLFNVQNYGITAWTFTAGGWVGIGPARLGSSAYELRTWDQGDTLCTHAPAVHFGP